jgi:ATP-dependent RNA helicase RhlE
VTDFSEFSFPKTILTALSEAGYVAPTPIQAAAIPEILKGRDLLALAQTGTGKTAAFALPMMAILMRAHGARAPRSVRSLILAPTRELAIQIHDNIRTYARHSHLRTVVIVGGVAIGPQTKALEGGVDILVATPGRLLDHMKQGTARIDSVSHLVLDEADRMLDMGFIHDIRRIAQALPKKRHSLMFSATMPADVEELGRFLLHQPGRIDLSPPKRTAENIEQKVYFVPGGDKRALLVQLLRDGSLARVIVFTRMKHVANRLAEALDKAGIAADAIHGNKSQNARQRALQRFKSGDVRVLVATDIAARGIDIDEVSHVVNFDLPNEPESYVHRIGRTARAGSSGVAISFCDGSETAYLRDIEKLTGQRLTVAAGEPLPPEPKAERDYAQKRPFRGGHRDGQKRDGQKREGHRGGHSGEGRARSHAPSGKPVGKPHGKPARANGGKSAGQGRPGSAGARSTAHGGQKRGPSGERGARS